MLTFGASLSENYKIVLRSVTYKDGYYVNLLLTIHSNVQFSSLFVIWPIWGWRLGHIATLELSLEFGCFWLVSIKLSHQNVVQKVAETCQKELIEHIVEHVASTTVRNLLHLTLPKLSSKENLYHFHYQHRGNTKRWCPLKISTNRIWFPCFFFFFFPKQLWLFTLSIDFPIVAKLELDTV